MLVEVAVCKVEHFNRLSSRHYNQVFVLAIHKKKGNGFFSYIFRCPAEKTLDITVVHAF